MYFTPAWIFGSSWVMSPTFCSLPVFRHQLHDADRADVALGALVEA